jgi:hypothetical protein
MKRRPWPGNGLLHYWMEESNENSRVVQAIFSVDTHTRACMHTQQEHHHHQK